MDVTTPEQARIAQEAGACAVMALERDPAQMVRAAGGVARMTCYDKGHSERSYTLLWQSAVSVILLKHRYLRLSR